jgi:transcriptional regulator with XRE-family HTH domain
MTPFHKWQALSDNAAGEVLGSFIKRTRLSQNKSQAFLAEAAGIHRSTLVQIENGRGGTINSFVRILRMLNKMDMLQIFEEDTQPTPMQLLKLQARKQRKRASGTRVKNSRRYK